MSDWRNLHEWMKLIPRLGEGWDFKELTALDLGCGRYESDIARQILTIPWLRLVSVDVFPPNIQEALYNVNSSMTKGGPQHWYSRVADVRDYIKDVNDKFFDFIFCFDVLEHLPKEDGEALIREMERVARKKIVLLVPREPDGFHRENIWPENQAEDHVSHWREQDFQKFGFLTETCADVHTEKDSQGHDINFASIWAIKDLI